MFVIPIFLILILTLFARIYNKDWLHPGLFILIFWSIAILSTVFFAPDYTIHASSLWWISLTLLTTYVGTLVGGASSLNKEFNARGASLNLVRLSGLFDLLSKLVLIALVFFILGVMILVEWATGGVGQLFSIDGLLDLGHKLSSMRYSGGEYKQPILYSIFTYGLSFAALIGGVLFFSSKRSHVYISIMPLILAFVNAIVKTQRGTIIFTVVLWLSSYLAIRPLSERSPIRLFTFQKIFLIIFLMFFALVIFVFLQASREGQVNFEFIETALLNFKSSAFGSLPAFSHWFDSTLMEDYKYTLGEFTFNRVAYYIFDVPARSPGMYGEAIWLGETYREGTTIYTVFRAMLQDWGMIGSLVSWFGVGLIGGFSYQKILQEKLHFLPWLSMYYAFVMIGYLASMFSWNGVIFSYAIFIIFFFWRFFWRKRLKALKF